MIRKILAVVVLAPLTVLLLLFAAANRQVVTVSFDPFDAAQPAYAASLPLFVLIFVLVTPIIVMNRRAQQRAEEMMGA